MTNLPYLHTPESEHNFPYTLGERTCSVFIRGDMHQTDRSNPNFEEIKTLLRSPRLDPQADALALDEIADRIISLMSPITAVIDATGEIPEIVVRDGAVFYNGEQIHSVLAERMLDVMSEGLPLDPWVKFAQNLYSNPAAFSRDELYSWLEKSDMPITPDGCLLAWKVVREDYKDQYTGTMDNSVGQTVTMPGGRQAVDPDRDRTCSQGLHFCSKGYLPSFGTGSGRRVVIVKVNPADVVSIPSDHNNEKGRCSRYQVVGEIDPTEAQAQQWGISVLDADPEDWEEWDEPEWDEDEDGETVQSAEPSTSPFKRLRDFLRG